ncbi:MFS transporter [Microbacterium karelineae]|uniref:MFS transporter n=1 Tax=Microbacterium karelineae TaxID=2654283 RepID=UPI0018D342D2|nr:MFS transporter [Microbacterium karelineae]
MRRAVALGALCASQLISWGILYYSLPVAAEAITREEGWSASAIMGTLTASMLVQAAVAVPVGHAMSRWGARRVMSTGTAIAAAALLAAAGSPTFALFFASWLVAGAAMSMTLYQAAFTAATEWFAPKPVGALTTVTIFGALASTVFAPIVSALADPLGWRAMYLVLAGVLAATVLPLHVFALLPHRARPRGGTADTRAADRAEVRGTLRSLPFIALTVAVSLGMLGVAAANLNLIPFAQERGLAHALGALAIGVCGAGQILGRIGYPIIAARIPVMPRLLASLLFSGLAVLGLALLPSPAWLLLLLAGLIGAARGITTLIMASGISELWGPRHYAVLAGYLSTPVAIAGAVAPWIGALTAEWTGSYGVAFIILGVGTLASSGLLIPVVRRRSPRPASDPVPVGV